VEKKRWRVIIDSPKVVGLLTYYITTYDLDQYIKTSNSDVGPNQEGKENYLASCVMERYEKKNTENVACITIEEVEF